MSKRTKNLILLIAIVQIILIIGLLALPGAVQAIPGRYRVALSERSPFLSEIAEGVIGQVAPVATALPAPDTAETGSQVDISALIAVKPTVTPTIPPAPTSEPTLATNVGPGDQPGEAAGVTAVPTNTPTPTPQPTATLTPTPLPQRFALEGMRVIKQTFNNCGPANLTQVLNYYGSEITQADVASYLKPNPEDRNVSPWQIRDYANEQTGGQFLASAHSGGTLELVKRLVVAGFPVVIEKGYELPASGWWGHYLTVYGYDDALQELYSQDSYLGPWDGSGRIDSYGEVEYYWQQFNYTFYVVYRPHEEAAVQNILGPEMVDSFTMWRNAAARAEQETITNPDDLFAWFNLGTALTRIGELTGEAEYYEGGAYAFDQARRIGLPPRMLWYQHRPYIAYQKVERFQDVIDLANATLEAQGGRNVEETYWYKGHALAAFGDIGGARLAYQAALDVNENFYPAQISLDWINSLGG